MPVLVGQGGPSPASAFLAGERLRSRGLRFVWSRESRAGPWAQRWPLGRLAAGAPGAAALGLRAW